MALFGPKKKIVSIFRYLKCYHVKRSLDYVPCGPGIELIPMGVTWGKAVISPT